MIVPAPRWGFPLGVLFPTAEAVGYVPGLLRSLIAAEASGAM